MTRLIKNELNRIYTCKINRISVLLLIMISVIYGFLTVFQDQTITYYEQGIIYGLDAITFEKNLSHGTVEINDDEINKVIDNFQKQTNNINNTDGEAFKTMYSKELRPYEEVISLIDFTLGGTYMDQYKKILEVKTPINFVELWKDKTNCTAKTQSFKSGYSKGYQRFLKKNMDLFLFMSIMLAICLSKMFSQDKEERMNEIISTTKNRGTNHFVAKVTAGIIISSFYYLLALVPFSIIIFSIYGLAGWDVNVQLGIAPLFPNLLTYGQLLSRAILIGLLASVLMGLLIMFYSKVFLSSSVSVICSIILCFIPNIMISLLNISSSSILRYCFPITMVDVSSVLNFDMTKLLFTLSLFFFLTFILIYDKKKINSVGDYKW